ncbi:MAG: protein-L-isoaspartate(D-aspartate) O-methyltransferase [Marinilabiliaceae bacterium]|nr:protein-L-isoaspartate(D-aspartate) O-methyltransferase [Marinilabiliaceae bacterium]
MVEESFLHKGLRAKLVEHLATKGITENAVLNAISKIPRHLFFDSSFLHFAYKDIAFPISAGQTISQPFTVATQSQLIEVKKGDKVLEIGTGSGYQTAVLCEMGLYVYTIERQKVLYDKTKLFLSKLGYNRIKFYFGDGYKGIPESAPFDAILITAATEIIPKLLLLQLKIGGKMVIPLGTQKQIMTRIKRISEHDFETEKFGDCRFVPMLTGVNG